MEKIRKELFEIARNSYERALLNCDDLFCPYWYCKKIGIDIVKVDDIEDNSCGYIIKKDNKFPIPFRYSTSILSFLQRFRISYAFGKFLV